MVPLIILAVTITILIFGMISDEETPIVIGVFGTVGVAVFMFITFMVGITSGIDNEYHLRTIQGHKLTTIQIPYLKNESEEELADRILNFFVAKNIKRKLQAEKIKELDLKLEFEILEEEADLKKLNLKGLDFQDAREDENLKYQKVNW